MASPKTRPMLQAPDVSVAVPTDALRPPRTDPDDSRFAGAKQFETPEAVRRRVQNGTVRTLNPETMPRAQPPEPGPTRQRSPEVSLSTKIPEYVMRELRRRYAETGITIRVQVLQALVGKGIHVEEDDLQDERKHPRR